MPTANAVNAKVSSLVDAASLRDCDDFVFELENDIAHLLRPRPEFDNADIVAYIREQQRIGHITEDKAASLLQAASRQQQRADIALKWAKRIRQPAEFPEFVTWTLASLKSSYR